MMHLRDRIAVVPSFGRAIIVATALVVPTSVCLAQGVVLWGSAPLPGIPRLGLHVNAELGDDDWSGTSGQPKKTLNKALQLAWDTNLGTNGFVDNIYVHASAVPIAPLVAVPVPVDFGGFEVEGWHTATEAARPPFPIRMINFVNDVGVSRAGAKPVITIDEFADDPAIGTPYTNWPGGEAKAVIRGARSCTLSNFKIHGLLDNTATNFSDWPAVHTLTTPTDNVENFKLLLCDIGKWHDGVCFEATLSKTLTASIEHCTLYEAWPIADMLGHAGMFMIGAGTHNVTLLSSTFRDSHDGVEFIADANTSAASTLTVTGCRFEDNETGLEIVEKAGASGTPLLTLDVSSTVFLRNHNLSPLDGIGGTPYEGGSTGAILVRGFPSGFLAVNAKMRGCEFRSSGLGILWRASMGSLDLGKVGDPGQNNFCLDFTPFDGIPAGEPTDPYRVCLLNQTTQTVNAVGNFWLRNNQGADGNGYLTIDPVTATTSPGVNMYTVDPFTLATIAPKPPGPEWGEFQPPLPSTTPFPRNYSIDATLATGGKIVFGPDLPIGTVPDCLVDP